MIVNCKYYIIEYHSPCGTVQCMDGAGNVNSLFCIRSNYCQRVLYERRDRERGREREGEREGEGGGGREREGEREEEREEERKEEEREKIGV